MKQEAPSCQYRYVWMPALWGTGQNFPLEGLVPAAERLWPGLPAALARPCGAPAFEPADLPLGAREMGAYLNDLEAFSAEAARGGDAVSAMLAESLRRDQETQLARELAEVQALAGSGAAQPAAQAAPVMRQRAQRLLAWFWFQQKNLAEIADLVRRVNSGVQGLGEGLAKDTAETPGLEAGVIPLATDLEEGMDEMGGDWRRWLEAALALTGEETVFVLDRLPEGLEAAAGPFDGGADFAVQLGAPEGIAVSGAVVPAGQLLPKAVWLPDAERAVRLVLVLAGERA